MRVFYYLRAVYRRRLRKVEVETFLVLFSVEAGQEHCGKVQAAVGEVLQVHSSQPPGFFRTLLTFHLSHVLQRREFGRLVQLVPLYSVFQGDLVVDGRFQNALEQVSALQRAPRTRVQTSDF